MLLLAPILATCLLAQQQQVDLILDNGNILIMDRAFSKAAAIAIHQGKVVATGDTATINRKYKATQRIDLKGRTAIPGFNDAHTHITPRSRRAVVLTNATSIAEVKAEVAKKAAELGPGEWVSGGDWAEDKFKEGRILNRQDLDEAAPNNPVALRRAGGHSSVSNSKALAIAGITRDTPQPDAGEIVHDAKGEPTGIIRERNDLVTKFIPPDTPAEQVVALRTALRDQFRHGITSLINARTNAADWPNWQAAYATQEDLPRAAVQILWSGKDKIQALGRKTGDGDDRLRLGAIKIFIDGGFTGRSGYTVEPYQGEKDFRGRLTVPRSALLEAFREAHALGWQLGVHTIGDRAAEIAVDLFEQVLKESPRQDHRHYLNHMSMRPPDHTYAKMKANNIWVTQQPNFTYTLEPLYLEYIGKQRTARAVPAKSLLDAGIFTAFSADILPISPVIGLYAAVTRKGSSGAVHGPEEAVSIRQALECYTRNGAYFTREEKIKGTLEPGMLADIAVLSKDPLKAAPEDIRTIEPDLVLLGGRKVYEKK
ncbi:amidohydrolase [Bryobacterales bacterium F-183]|nr:amidohydrolase [Bryobacterales bacterium F-183]